MKARFSIFSALVLVVMCFLNGCGVVYEGKYGEYTLTPTGTVVIKPKYAQQPTSDKD
jgi:hypothetical protein